MSTPTTLIAHRYRLVKLLGAGGMGVVWQAWDERLQRTVALKMLRTSPETSESERDLSTERAMREARITAGLHHPHAVTVFDVIEHEGRPCIVMQLIESTTLSALLTENGALTPSQTAQIGAQVASALAAAHTLRIVHRDVKPGNILITADGSALISDFGISHALGDATITATGLIHGTPAYLAPEVAKGLPTSFASDVFSLGSTIYAMLEGAPPFGTDNNAISLLHKVARGGYAPPRNAGPLAPLLKQMLATNPKRRPTMAAVAASLAARQGNAAPPAVFPDGVAVLTEMLNGGAPDWEDQDASTEALEEPLLTPPPAATRGAAPTPAATPDTATPDTATPDAATEALDDEPTAAILAMRAAETEVVDARSTALLEEATRPSPAPTPDAPTVSMLAAGEQAAFGSPTAETEPVRPGPAPAVLPAAAAPPTNRRRRSGAIAAILVLVTVLIVAGAVLINPWRSAVDDAGRPVGTTAPTETSAPQTSEAEPTPPAAVDPAPVPTATEPQPAPATPEQQVVETVSDYYAMLPGDLDAAWPLMTADYQENHAGGRSGYEAFWSNVVSVEIADLSASAPDQGQATLTYRFTDGRVVQEVTSYQLVDEGGVLKIAGTEVLSSSQL